MTCFHDYSTRNSLQCSQECSKIGISVCHAVDLSGYYEEGLEPRCAGILLGWYSRRYGSWDMVGVIETLGQLVG